MFLGWEKSGSEERAIDDTSERWKKVWNNRWRKAPKDEDMGLRINEEDQPWEERESFHGQRVGLS